LKKQSQFTFSNNSFEKALKLRDFPRGETTKKLAAKYPPG
jgi:hypothetical protein